MADFLDRLVARSAFMPQAVQARQRSAHEPLPAELPHETRPEPDGRAENAREANVDLRVQPPLPSPWRGPLETVTAPAVPEREHAPHVLDTHGKVSVQGKPVVEIECHPAAVSEIVTRSEPARPEPERLPATRAEHVVAPSPVPVRSGRSGPGAQPQDSPSARAVADERIPRNGAPRVPARPALEPGVIKPREFVVAARGRPVDEPAPAFPKHGAPQEHAATTPAIHVTIGRIEVRAVREPERPAEKRAVQPRLTLEDYQRDRRMGKR